MFEVTVDNEVFIGRTEVIPDGVNITCENTICSGYSHLPDTRFVGVQFTKDRKVISVAWGTGTYSSNARQAKQGGFLPHFWSRNAEVMLFTENDDSELLGSFASPDEVLEHLAQHGIVPNDSNKITTKEVKG